MVRAGEDAWFIGDAAGLVRPTDGGGIHYALESAHLLASSLLGGTPYERAMRPLLEPMAQDAQRKRGWYVAQSLLVATRGHELSA